MKRFLSLFLTAMILTLVISLSLLVLTTSAVSESENPKNVIFVSDNYSSGDGSGKDAANPLRPVDVDDHFIKETIVYDETTGAETNRYGRYYLKTPLYQAAEKLVDTGGTIVICGTVSINGANSHGSSDSFKDFVLPTSEHELTITSVYNGVDYSATANGGAVLEIAFPSYLLMGSPSVFENITIRTAGAAGRAICACGNKIVMGDGIKCTLADPSVDASGSGGGYYLSIAGGKRFGDYKADSNVTIKSGTYAYISGSTWGVNRTEPALDAEGNEVEGQTRTAVDIQTGDVTINLLGGIFRGAVCGTSTNTAGVALDGNVYINISGNASIRGHIYATCDGKFANDSAKVYMNVTGGEFNAIKFLINKDNTGSLNSWNTEPCYDAEYTLNISNDASIKRRSNASGKDALLSDFVAGWKGDKILYPSSWITSVVCDGANGTVKPTTPATVINGEHKPEGAVLSATFTNKSTNAVLTQLVEYDEKNTSFDVEYDTSSKKVSYLYGGVEYYSASYEAYAEAPEVELLGARLKTTGDKQGLRFVGQYATPENATVTETGVLVLKSYMLKNDSELTLDKVFGNVKIVASDDDKYVYSNMNRFECAFESINQREFVQDYTARAYVKYTVDGNEYVSYSDVAVKNPYEMAKTATDDGSEEDSVTIAYLETNLIEVANNFSVTTQYVSDAELETLQQKVVDYMELMANIEWTPQETFAMYNNVGDRTLETIEELRGSTSNGDAIGVSMAGIFEKGKYYYGMPYTSSSKSWMQTANFESFNRLMELTYEMDEFTPYTGTKVPQTLSAWNSDSHNSSMASWMYYNLKKDDGIFGFGAKPERRYDAYVNYTIIPGSHCSKAVFSAWNQVLNNSTATSRLTATYRIVPGANSNVIPVGNYVYKGITAEGDSRQIIENNGIVFNTNTDGKILSINYEASNTDVMYNSYAALRPGDGLIHYTDSGHTRLVVSVDYNSEDPGSSIVTTLECANWSVPFVNPSKADSAESGVTEGWKLSNSCWMVRKYSFDNLLITTYLPSRITELSTGLVDKLSVVMTDTDIAEGKLNGTISSNMQIVSVDVTVTGNGVNKQEVIYLTSEAMHLAKYDITELDLTTRFGLTAGNTYNITLKVGTPGIVSGFTTDAKYPNSVEGDTTVATGYTPTFTTIWDSQTFVA